MMRVFQPNGLYSIRYVTYLFSNPYLGETQTTFTHRTNLTLHFIMVNIFRIIALRDINAWLYYVRCNVYYYPAALIHNIIICGGVLNTLEWTLNPINFSNILCHKVWFKKYILWSAIVQYILCTMCNHIMRILTIHDLSPI